MRPYPRTSSTPRNAVGVSHEQHLLCVVCNVVPKRTLLVGSNSRAFLSSRCRRRSPPPTPPRRARPVWQSRAFRVAPRARRGTPSASRRRPRRDESRRRRLRGRRAPSAATAFVSRRAPPRQSKCLLAAQQRETLCPPKVQRWVAGQAPRRVSWDNGSGGKCELDNRSGRVASEHTHTHTHTSARHFGDPSPPARSDSTTASECGVCAVPGARPVPPTA